MPATADHVEPSVIDLRSFLRSVGGVLLSPGPMTDPGERPVPDNPAELIDESRVKVTADPSPIDAFVDGTQAIVTVAWREHRPVHLLWVAAGAVGERGRPLACVEELGVTCAPADVEWVKSLGGNVPVLELPGSDPTGYERAAALMLGARREEAERRVVSDLISTGRGVIVVDGSLLGRSPSPRLMGLVKSTRTRYLADESVLWGLPVGWRSPRFKLPRMGGPERFSCYLRLFDATHASWSHGLVRVESFDADLIDPFCARALAERQTTGANDPRWDRHLGGVRACEEFIKSRRPAVFS